MNTDDDGFPHPDPGAEYQRQTDRATQAANRRFGVYFSLTSLFLYFPSLLFTIFALANSLEIRHRSNACIFYYLLSSMAVSACLAFAAGFYWRPAFALLVFEFITLIVILP